MILSLNSKGLSSFLAVSKISAKFPSSAHSGISTGIAFRESLGPSVSKPTPRSFTMFGCAASGGCVVVSSSLKMTRMRSAIADRIVRSASFLEVELGA